MNSRLKSNFGQFLAIVLFVSVCPLSAAEIDPDRIHTQVKYYIDTFALADPTFENKMTFLITDYMANALRHDHLTWYDFQQYAVENSLELSIQTATSHLPSGVASLSLPLLEDDSLLEDLFENAKANGKVFSSKIELKTIISDGLQFLRSIQLGRTTKRADLIRADGTIPSATYVFAAILWYLQAKSGRKFLLHPETWQIERGIVGGGTYRFSDPEHRLYSVLTKLDSNVYRRLSSHYQMETEASSFVFFKHWGFDSDLREKIFLPGKKDTRSVLFGKLKEDQIFMKTETHGVNLLKPREVAEHLRSYFHFRATTAEVGSGLEPHAHRENTNKKLTALFNDLLEHTLKGKDKEKYEFYKKRGRRGVYEMANILQSDSSLADNPSAQSIIAMLKNYISILCEGDLSTDPHSLTGATIIQIKGCESIVRIEPAGE